MRQGIARASGVYGNANSPRMRPQKCAKEAYKPSSVPAQHAGGDHLSSPAVADEVMLPTRGRAGRPILPLLGIAPDGVCLASDVATGAVRSYRAFSPLPL